MCSAQDKSEISKTLIRDIPNSSNESEDSDREGGNAEDDTMSNYSKVRNSDERLTHEELNVFGHRLELKEFSRSSQRDNISPQADVLSLSSPNSTEYKEIYPDLAVMRVEGDASSFLGMLSRDSRDNKSDDSDLESDAISISVSNKNDNTLF